MFRRMFRKQQCENLYVSNYLWEEFYQFPSVFEDVYKEGDRIHPDDFIEFTTDAVEKAFVYLDMIYAQLIGYVATDDLDSAESEDGFGGGYDIICVPYEFIYECDVGHLCTGWDYIVDNAFLKRKRKKMLI